MKKILILSTLLFCCHILIAQVDAEGMIIRWNPENSTAVAVANVDVEIHNHGSVAATGITTDAAPGLNLNYFANPTINPNLNPGSSGYFLKTIPTKDTNPLNGVSVLDYILITQYILGNYDITNPLLLISADVNNSGGITISDIIDIRSLILNRIQEFVVPSWRFLEVSYLFNFSQSQNGFIYRPQNWIPFFANPFSANMDGREYPEFLDSPKTHILGASAQYFPLSHTSFFAIKTGDVNESANPLLRRTPTPEWEATSLTIPAGSEGSIILRAEDFQNIAGYQMGFRFDPSQVQLLDALPGDLPGFDSENFNIDNKTGEFRTMWVDKKVALNTLEKGAAIYKIRFKALQNIYDTQELLLRDASILAPEFYNQSEITSAQLSIDFQLDEKEQWTTAIQATPNPFFSSTLLNFELASATTATIEILDLSGKVLAISQDQFQEGWNGFELTPSMALPKGTLIVRITTPLQSISGKIVKLE